jgi:hypothetical protein
VRRFSFPLIVGAAFLGSTGTASAVPAMTAQDQADANCLIAISFAASQAAETEQEGLGSILTYFAGKLKGRHPGIGMTEVMTPDLVRSVMPNLKSELLRCSQEAIELGEDLKAAGTALTEAGY